MAAHWLEILAIAFLALSFLCTVLIIAMLFYQPQRMAVMNVVWPVTALYWGPVAPWALWDMGAPPVSPAKRRHQQEIVQRRKAAGESQKRPAKPFWKQVFVGVTHCGAGCTLGDIIGEWLVHAFGWQWFGNRLYAEFIIDFALAYSLGLVFQYLTITPMRGLGPIKGIIAAAKADTISIIAFEIGLFGWMALNSFILFPGESVASWNHWFQMQVGMIIGFFTSYPANWFLLRAGLKEAM